MPSARVSAPRAPSAIVAVDPDRVLRCVRRYESKHRRHLLLLMLLGVCVLWLGPVIATCILYVIEIRANAIPDSWMHHFMLCSIVLIPLLFVLEWATRGQFIEGAVDGIGGEDIMTASAGHRAGSVLALLTEVSLWGPRRIMGGIIGLRRNARFGSRRRETGAAVLAVLAGSEEGMSSAFVMRRSGLDADAFADALAYLTYHDWIGISKDGMVLWILSEARRRLA
jgi:hypothetical protein